MRTPTTDDDWLRAAWWIEALHLAGDATTTIDLARLREATIARVETDNSILALDPGATPFAATAPMGAAKRAKSHIYAHACGGLHLVQAGLRAAADGGSAEHAKRARHQLKLLVARYRAERELYGGLLQTMPMRADMLGAQQLKFFGHLLETLALAASLGLATGDVVIERARVDAAADLVGAIETLKRVRAYDALEMFGRTRPQMRLDLIGDGCHAVRGLGSTLAILPTN